MRPVSEESKIKESKYKFYFHSFLADDAVNFFFAFVALSISNRVFQVWICFASYALRYFIS